MGEIRNTRRRWSSTRGQTPSGKEQPKVKKELGVSSDEKKQGEGIDFQGEKTCRCATDVRKEKQRQMGEMPKPEPRVMRETPLIQKRR